MRCDSYVKRRAGEGVVVVPHELVVQCGTTVMGLSTFPVRGSQHNDLGVAVALMDGVSVGRRKRSMYRCIGGSGLRTG